MHDDDRDHDYGLSLFDSPPAEWTDHELAVGLAVLGQEIAVSDVSRAPRLTELAIVLAEERDRRAAVYRVMADAVCPVQVVMPGRILRSSSERRRDRGRG